MSTLLKSPRFLGVLIIGILQTLVLFGLISGEQGEGLVQILQGVIAASVIVRTTDRLGDKKVEAAEVNN